jgi:hypothetical protein
MDTHGNTICSNNHVGFDGIAVGEFQYGLLRITLHHSTGEMKSCRRTLARSKCETSKFIVEVGPVHKEVLMGS